MSFLHPHLLAFLFVPAIVLLAEVIFAGTADALRWPRIRRLWAGPQGVSASRASARFRPRWRLALGLALLATALARPQWGQIEEKVFDQSREVLIALDLSRSMLATDVAPTRLDRARLLVQSLLDKLHGERVGLLLFSGTAFLQSPLSADYEVLRDFLPALNPDYLPEGGTDYAALLKAAGEAFSSEAGADRYLIILSDGEAENEDWRQQLDTLRRHNIRVLSLGVGTEAGSVIPAKEGGLIKDERGAVVMSKLNPVTLQQLASATGGAYADASSWVDLPGLLQQTIDRGKAGAFSERKTIRLGERFQWFLAPGLLFLFWSYGQEFPVRPRPRDLRAKGPSGSTPTAPTPAVSVTAFLILALGLNFLAPSPVAAATLSPPPAAPAAPPPPELPKVVAHLAAQPGVSAADCATLAEETIRFGEATRQSGQPVKPGIVRDGLDAVSKGEKADAKAADWPSLRQKLGDLLKPLPPPPEKKQDQKQQQKQDRQKQDQQKQNQQEQGKPEEQKSQEKSQKSDAGQKPEQPENPPPPTGQPPAEPPPMQRIGGEPPTNQELRDQPQLTEPLQKLDQVRDQDKPATLYQLMHDNEPKPGERPKHDW